MFLCSLRYCLKCYFSKGVYSFTLSTVCIAPSFIMFFFAPRSDADALCDSYDHVNPHVLLFAASCACRINPLKTNVSIFNGSQTLIISNLI